VMDSATRPDCYYRVPSLCEGGGYTRHPRTYLLEADLMEPPVRPNWYTCVAARFLPVIVVLGWIASFAPQATGQGLTSNHWSPIPADGAPSARMNAASFGLVRK